MGSSGSREPAGGGGGGGGGEHKAPAGGGGGARGSGGPGGAAGGAQQAEYTAQQIRMLMQRGLKPDMALLPFQMKRMQDESFAALPPPKPRRTVTYKSLVNLNKKSLRLVPYSVPIASSSSSSTTTPPAPPHARLSFSFDALTPVHITVLLFVTEIIGERNSTLRFEQNVVKRPQRIYRFPAGNDQHFLQDEDDSMNLSWVTDTQLSHDTAAGFYPLVVHLETPATEGEEKISELSETKRSGAPTSPTHGGAAAASSSASAFSTSPSSSIAATAPLSISTSSTLSSSPPPPLSPSASTPLTAPTLTSTPSVEAKRPHVKSQTTFSSFTRTSTGGLDVRVIKQKIKVGNQSYELQEIYGLEPKAPSGTGSSGDGSGGDGTDTGGATAGAAHEDPVQQECVVCMSNPRDTTLLPCRHMCLCAECAGILRMQTNRCPICRTMVESLLSLPMGRVRPADGFAPTIAMPPPKSF